MNYTVFNDEVEIGQKVRYYRKLRNVSQSQLAEWTGVSKGVIMRLEKDNRVPSADIMFSIAKHLEIPPIYIFRGSTYTFFIYELMPEKSYIHPENVIERFGITRISCDFFLNANDYFSVIDGNKRYLARKNFTDNCTRALCVDKNYKCIICNKTEFGFLNEADNTIVEDECIVAGIIQEITDISDSVIFNL